MGIKSFLAKNDKALYLVRDKVVSWWTDHRGRGTLFVNTLDGKQLELRLDEKQNLYDWVGNYGD